MPKMLAEDTEKLRTSLDRLWQIYKDIGETATQVSTWRCPYKNRHDRCTANFGCRNQLRTEGLDQLPICAGSDDLDYQSAWET